MPFSGSRGRSPTVLDLSILYHKIKLLIQLIDDIILERVRLAVWRFKFADGCGLVDGLGGWR